MKDHFPIFKYHPRLVYLDSAATTLKPQSVIDKEIEYYTKYSANIHRGLYKLSQDSSNNYDQSRKIIAKFINAKTDEIIFTPGTTASINLVVQSWGDQNIQTNDEIIITQMEHHSNLIPWQQLAQKKQATLKYLPVNHDFTLDLKSLSKLVTSKTRIVALTHVSNVLGTINPLKKIIEIVKKINPSTLVLIDAAQSIAHLPIDVVKLNIDFLAFSGHKLYGPTGVGCLFVKKNILENLIPFVFGGGTIKEVFWDRTIFTNPPEVFEPGTPPIAQVIALAESIKFIESIGWSTIIDQETKLTKYAIKQLSTIPEIKIFGPQENRLGVISFTFIPSHLAKPHDLGDILSSNFNIAVRTGFHCAMPLHRQFNLKTGSTRISLGIYNSQTDIDIFIKGVLQSIETFS